VLLVLLLCRDFVTGFRKRKQQRRKEANSQLEKKAKKTRVEQRAEVGSAGVVAIKYAGGAATVLASSCSCKSALMHPQQLQQQRPSPSGCPQCSAAVL
jgi:hypothetical protein